MTKIVVTQEDIKNGIPKSEICCPIALACKRTDIIGDNTFPEVMTDSINVYESQTLFDFDSEFVEAYALPKEAQQFIKRFDAGLPVEPFEFEV